MSYAHSAGVLHLRLEPVCIQLTNAYCDVQVSGIGRTRTGNKKTSATTDKKSPMTAGSAHSSTSGISDVTELVLTTGTRSVNFDIFCLVLCFMYHYSSITVLPVTVYELFQWYAKCCYPYIQMHTKLQLLHL
jgi:hypothetical protein